MKVQDTAPVPPTAGAELTVHPVKLAGSGVPHDALTKVVEVGVLSLMTMFTAGNPPIFVYVTV